MGTLLRELQWGPEDCPVNDLTHLWFARRSTGEWRGKTICCWKVIYTREIIVGLSSFGPTWAPCLKVWSSIRLQGWTKSFFLLSYSAVRMLLLVQSTMLVMVARIWESMRTTQSSTHMDCWASICLLTIILLSEASPLSWSRTQAGTGRKCTQTIS